MARMFRDLKVCDGTERRAKTEPHQLHGMLLVILNGMRKASILLQITPNKTAMMNMGTPLDL